MCLLRLASATISRTRADACVGAPRDWPKWPGAGCGSSLGSRSSSESTRLMIVGLTAPAVPRPLCVRGSAPPTGGTSATNSTESSSEEEGSPPPPTLLLPPGPPSFIDIVASPFFGSSISRLASSGLRALPSLGRPADVAAAFTAGEVVPAKAVVIWFAGGGTVAAEEEAAAECEPRSQIFLSWHWLTLLFASSCGAMVFLCCGVETRSTSSRPKSTVIAGSTDGGCHNRNRRKIWVWTTPLAASMVHLRPILAIARWFNLPRFDALGFVLYGSKALYFTKPQPHDPLAKVQSVAQ
mmetsp:Transcript_3361/g.7446  ORF Transcript_3361/g.7446 Transcript_3361/m.7446 type:complete len:296 (+) Transcript_3361:685-1572(+)